jgi:hypothetical protein
MIKRICEKHAKPSIKTTSKVNNAQGHHQFNDNAYIEHKTRVIEKHSTSKGCSNAAHQKTRRRTSPQQLLPTTRTVLHAGEPSVCLGKSTFQFQDLLLELDDGNSHGCRKLVLVHLP